MALFVCHPALAGGHILQVDAGWGPEPPPLQGGFYAPISLIQTASSYLIGTAAVSRVYLVGIVTLCAYGPALVLHRARWYARLVAGALGAFNPWVYERLIDGQWTVVAAGGSLGLFLAAWERLLERPSPRRAIAVATAATLTVAFSPHFVLLLVIIAVASAVSRRAWQQPELLGWMRRCAGLTAAMLLYGVVLFFAGSGQGSYSRVQAVGAADFSVFASAADPHYGLLANLVGLQGFWAERTRRFVTAYGTTTLWPVSALTLAAAAFVGAWLRRERAWLLATGVLGVCISASTALPGGAGLAATLAEHVPLLGAWREPEKASALWMLAEAVLVGSLIDRLAEGRGRLRQAVAGPALAVGLVVAILVPAGLTAIRQLPRTLTPVSYPPDWTAAAAFLRAHAAHDTVLVLPWHLYEAIPFARGRVVGNPAPVVFPAGRLLSSADAEIPGDPPLQSPGGVAAAALYPTRDCSLASAARRSGASWVVIEPVLEGPDDANALVRCGFSPAEGGSGARVLRVTGG